jgi:Uma2 family endonuclease
METINFPPRTIMQVFKMLPEGTLAELIDGNLYMSPSPTMNHQRIVQRLLVSISNFIETSYSGEIFISPVDVFLDEHNNAVQPDILFISSERRSIIKPDAIHGTPDMVIEILSPSNSKHDLVQKRVLYEKFGVKEYWVINPDTKESIGFFLEGQYYTTPVTEQGKIVSRILSQTFAF